MHQRSNTSPHPFEEHFDFKVECFASAAEDATTKSLAFDLKVHIFTEGEECREGKILCLAVRKTFSFYGRILCINDRRL